MKMRSIRLGISVTTLLLSLGGHLSTAKTLKTSFSSHLIPGASGSHGLPSSNGLSLFGWNGSSSSTPTDNAVLKVVTTVQAGNNQTFTQVLVDTGSAILWVGGEDAYVPGPNTVSINETFSVGYGAGGVNGTAYNDTVMIGDAVVDSQIIGAASYMTGFDLVAPIDGILGLGPSGSNAGEVIGNNDTATPTFVENLYAQGSIDEKVFGIYVSGINTTTGEEVGQGEITFGGVDWEKVDGPITWVQQNEPYNFHWEFNVSAFSWGNTTLVNSSTSSRTDTGALAIGLPIDTLITIVNLTNASYITTNQSSTLAGFLSFPPASNTTDDLPPITFYLGSPPPFTSPTSFFPPPPPPIYGTPFMIQPSQYLIPESLYPALNLTVPEGDATRYSWLTSAGFGEFQMGQKWLEGVYTVYDMGMNRVGFGHLRP